MIARKSSSTKNLRCIFIIIILSSILFLYYSSSSIYFKSAVYKLYYNVNFDYVIMKQINNTAPDLDTQLGTIKKENLNSTIHISQFEANQMTNSIIQATNKTSQKIPLVYKNSSALATTFKRLQHNNTSSVLELCPMIPSNLGTRIQINKTTLEIEKIEYSPSIRRLNLKLGGKGKPQNCTARYKVAIIIPYRDRLKNLQLFLKHMHPFLNKQQLEYGIYIIEPIEKITFNRGLLMNIGFVEAIKDTNKWDCFVFHDVDLLPEDERNIYSCPETPRHMSSAVSTLKYKLPYDAIFGGVTGFTKEHFKRINGFSNLYFGWGGEDDDLRNRVIKTGLSVSRYPLEVGRYYMDAHKKDKPNPERFKLLKNGKKRFKKDGITSLKYTVKRIERTNLFSKIYVDYNQKEILTLKS